MSQELFKEWKDHAITKLIWEYLEDSRKNYRTLLEGEANIYEPHYARISAKYIGAIQVINNLLNIDFHEVVGDEEEVADE